MKQETKISRFFQQPRRSLPKTKTPKTRKPSRTWACPLQWLGTLVVVLGQMAQIGSPEKPMSTAFATPSPLSPPAPPPHSSSPFVPWRRRRRHISRRGRLRETPGPSRAEPCGGASSPISPILPVLSSAPAAATSALTSGAAGDGGGSLRQRLHGTSALLPLPLICLLHGSVGLMQIQVAATWELNEVEQGSEFRHLIACRSLLGFAAMNIIEQHIARWPLNPWPLIPYWPTSFVSLH